MIDKENVNNSTSTN